jgi:hypothetical protein
MTVVTVQSLRDTKPLEYRVLTDEDEYIAGGQFFDWGMSEAIDSFRVGPNIEDDFCIEDSIGRFIPFNLEDIDSLIDILMTYRQEHAKDVKIASLEAQIRELEDGS